MIKRPSFLFISASDINGGASIVAYQLHNGLLARGYTSKMVVSRKFSNDDSVIEINSYSKKIIHSLVYGDINFPFSYRIGKMIELLKESFYKYLKKSRKDVFFYPASRRILNLINYKPDIIQLHDIHDDYFDISLIKKWSNHSAIFFKNCDLWLFGDWDQNKKEWVLDQTIAKRSITENVKINYIHPSEWVKNKLTGIKLHPKSVERVIKDTVDLQYFYPSDRNIARKALGIDEECFLILTMAFGFKDNPHKDITTVLKAFKKVNQIKINTKLLVVGDSLHKYNEINTKNIIFFEPCFDKEKIRNIYRSANIYVHSTFIETWCLTITEARASGLPIIASNVGAIPEQIINCNYNNLKNGYVNNENGILFDPGSDKQLANYINILYDNESLCKKLGENSRKNIEDFGMEELLNSNLEYYHDVLNSSN